MSFLSKSILNPSTSVLVGLANGAIVTGIYQYNLPNAASIRVADSHDHDIEGARKQAAWASAAVLGFMFLVTRDRNSLLIGGLVLAVVDMTVKHSNGLNPTTGQLDGTASETIDPSLSNTYSLPDYSQPDDMAQASGY